jgi:hypothetical protein
VCPTDKSPSAQQQFLGFTLQNFTVKKFKALGTCENAAVELIGHEISPAFPICSNSTPSPPPPPPSPSPSPPPARHHCTIQAKNERW